MPSHVLPLLVIGALAVPAFALPPAIPAEKTVITSADQLPRRNYLLPKLPSELLEAPKSELDALVEALDLDIANDLLTLDIQDRPARTAMLLARAQFAIHRGDLRGAQKFLREARAQQEKAADKLTTGVAMENILETRIRGGSLDEQRARLRAALESAWGGMPWSVVGDNLDGAKSAFELMARNAAIGAVRTTMDPAAKNLGLNVPYGIVIAIVSIRTQFEHMLPFKEAMVGVLQELVDRNRVARSDTR